MEGVPDVGGWRDGKWVKAHPWDHKAWSPGPYYCGDKMKSTGYDSFLEVFSFTTNFLHVKLKLLTSACFPTFLNNKGRVHGRYNITFLFVFVCLVGTLFALDLRNGTTYECEICKAYSFDDC